MFSQQGNIKEEEIYNSTIQCINYDYQSSETISSDATSCAPCNEEEFQQIEASIVLPSGSNIERDALLPSNREIFRPGNDSTTDLNELNTTQQNAFDDEDQNEYNNRGITPLSNICEFVESAENDHIKDSGEEYSVEGWVKTSLNGEDKFHLEYYVRDQTRKTLHELGQNEEEIKLGRIKQAHNNNNTNGESYWFHATSSKKAQEFIEFGPNFSQKLADFSVNGAFYLNPSYTDCYQWLITNNSQFNGDHVMLIYKFDPKKISKKGEELTKQQWEQSIFKRNERSRRSDPDWSYVYQSANPGENARNQRARWTKDGQRAMQLVIRSKKMCKKLRPCLVGCVYYQNVAIREIPDQHQPCLSSTVENYSETINLSILFDTDNDSIANTEQEEENDSNGEPNVDSISTFQMAERYSKSYKQKQRSGGCQKSKQNEKSLRKSKHKEFNKKNHHSYID